MLVNVKNYFYICNMKNLIKGLPHELRNTPSYDYNKLFEQTTELLYVDGNQFITQVSAGLGHPAWFNEQVALFYTVAQLRCEINGRLQDFPITATFQFFRRPQDDAIICVVMCSSLVVHFDFYEDGVLNKFTQVGNTTMRITKDKTSEYAFMHWCSERVGNWKRRDKISEIIDQEDPQ